MCEPSVKELHMLVNRPLTKFKNASKKVCEHFHDSCKSASASRGRGFHQAALEGATTFTAMMKIQTMTKDHQLSSEWSKHVVENFQKLQSIVENVILCGRQGIPFEVTVM